MQYARCIRMIAAMLLASQFGGGQVAAQNATDGQVAGGQRVSIYQGSCDQLGGAAFELGTLEADPGFEEDEAGVAAGAGAEGATGAGTSDFTAAAGADNTFDANDEGFLREDLNNDDTFEVGADENASGALDENEVLGTDRNNDEALTDDELSS